MGHDPVVDLVKRLIAVCHEGEMAYRSAAEQLTDLQGQALFMDLAQKRALGARALSGLVASAGEETAGPDRAAPPASVGSHGPLAPLEHLRRVEERTLDELGKVLAQDLPMDVRLAVDQQYRAVRRAYGRLVTLPRGQDR
jgi:hypothetical protein